MSGFFKRREGYGLFDNIILHLFYQNKLVANFPNIHNNPNITLEFIEKNIEKIEIDRAVFLNPNLTLEFIEKHYNKLFLAEILRHPSLDLRKKEVRKFLKKHLEDISWENLSRNPHITLEFIEEYKLLEKMQNCDDLISNPAFNFRKKEFRNWFDKKDLIFNYLDLSWNPTLSFKFVKRYKNLLAWNALSQRLIFDFTKDETWKFIEINAHRIDWVYLSMNTNLTMEFIEKNLNKLSWDEVICNPSLTLEFIEKHIENILPYFNEELAENKL